MSASCEGSEARSAGRVLAFELQLTCRMRKTAATAILVLHGLVACGTFDASSGDNCSTGKCDSVPLKCKVTDRSGSGRSLSTLSDPIANLVLRADGCPSVGPDVRALVEACKPSSVPKNIVSSTVSERGQLGLADATFRAVRQFDCEQGTVFLSFFGLSKDQKESDDVEIMARAADSDTFNFYKLSGGSWAFFGSSTDLLAGADDQGNRDCATCHVSGAPIMKELRAPWVHWNQGMRALEVLETNIREEQRPTADARARVLKERGTVKEMLAPVFCTQDFNLGGHSSLAANFVIGLREIRMNLFLNVSDTPAIQGDFDAAYETAIAAAHQRVEGDDRTPLRNASGQVIADLNAPLVYPERSGADQAYFESLVGAGHITQRLFDDVSMVDFTRSVFSDRRCALLDHAPMAAAKDMSAAQIVEAFTSSLRAKRGQGGLAPWETDFLASLEDTANDDDHWKAQLARLEATFATCEALPPDVLVGEAVKLASQLREMVRPFPVMESREQLPVDDLHVDPRLRLNPATCRLTAM